jgi:aldehyde dehydrogenase family 7 member A1
VATLCLGGSDIGEKMIQDRRIPVISFTGSTHVGRHVSMTVASRFGQSILELGGNNAISIMDDADLDVALR